MKLYKFWWTWLGEGTFDHLESDSRGKAKVAALRRVRADYTEAKFTEIRIVRVESRD